jgi:hypothetical protein
MRIERQRRRSNLPLIGCGCATALAALLAIGAVVVILLVAFLPDITLRLNGFSPVGQTERIFQEVEPAPTIVVNNPVTPPDVVVDLGQYGSQEIPPATSDYTVVTGSTDTGASVAMVSFHEAALLNLCRERSEICRNENPQYQNVRIDLRPGGAVVYGDVTVPNLGIQQTAGVVLRLDGTGRQFEVAGVDIGGALYDTPPGDMSALADDLQRIGNDVLNQLSIQAGGSQYRLSQVQVDDTTLTLVLQ